MPIEFDISSGNTSLCLRLQTHHRVCSTALLEKASLLSAVAMYLEGSFEVVS